MTPTRVGFLLISLCLIACWQVLNIPESAIQMAVGPALAPASIVGLLLCLAFLYTLSAWRGRQVDEASEPSQAALPGAAYRMLALLSGGVVFMGTVSFAGFVLPATLCGMLIARSFNATLGLRSFLICSCISTGFWFLFNPMLGVGIGPATPFGF